MTETIEEKLADIHKLIHEHPDDRVYITDFVTDIANAVSQLADVVKEINEQTNPPTYVISVDPPHTIAIRINNLPKEREVEKLRQKIFDIEVREDLVIIELGRQIKTLKTELDIAIQIGRNLKAERDDLAKTNDTQAYVIRNRINSFGEGVFAKAIEDDMTDLENDIIGLDAERKVRKGDSEVLMKVVELVKIWRESHDVKYMHRIDDVVKDYVMVR